MACLVTYYMATTTNVEDKGKQELESWDIKLGRSFLGQSHVGRPKVGQFLSVGLLPAPAHTGHVCVKLSRETSTGSSLQERRSDGRLK